MLAGCSSTLLSPRHRLRSEASAQFQACHFPSMNTQRLDLPCSFGRRDASRSQPVRPVGLSIEKLIEAKTSACSLRQSIKLVPVTTESKRENRDEFWEKSRSMKKRSGAEVSYEEETHVSRVKRKRSNGKSDGSPAEEEGHLSLGQLWSEIFWFHPRFNVHFPSDANMDSRQENASNKTNMDSRRENASNKTNRGKRKIGHFNINLQDLEPYFGQKLKDVAEKLGVSRSTIKRICRENGIQRWPSNENQKKNPSIFMGESAKESAQDSQQNMRPSPFSNLPPSDMPPHQNAPHTNPESSRGLIVQPKDDMVVIKATYEEDTVKFQLCNSAGMEKLAEEVAMRLNLEMGSFRLKYLDKDNDEILLACDADLQLYLKSPTAAGRTCIQVVCRKTQSSVAVDYVDQLPSHLRGYILRTKDVASDGHCGFRVIAALLGFGDDAWHRVRRDLLEEITSFEAIYASVFIERDRVGKLKHMLNCFEQTTSESHWMDISDMGHVIASRYNVAVVSLSPIVCCTYLPLRTPMVEPPTCICIGFVNDNHFVQVFMRPGHPLPPVPIKWSECRYDCALEWYYVYTQQFNLYNQICINNSVVDRLDMVNLDDT